MKIWVFGQSVEGRPLYAIKVGQGERTVLITASIHAREWVTSWLAMRQVEDALKRYKTDQSTKTLLDNVSLIWVPMVNPDGIPRQRSEPSWKANARGVDLNYQFPSCWESIPSETGGPAAEGWKGLKPLSEPEAMALKTLTEEVDPAVLLNYHSAGEVIYWAYGQKDEALSRDKRLAREVAALTGYSLMPYTGDDCRDAYTYGGHRDWFIKTSGRPGLTIEVGRTINDASVPLEEFQGIWERNGNTPLAVARWVTNNLPSAQAVTLEAESSWDIWLADPPSSQPTQAKSPWDQPQKTCVVSHQGDLAVLLLASSKFMRTGDTGPYFPVVRERQIPAPKRRRRSG